VIAFATCKPILLAARSLSRRRHPLDPTPSFEDLINDLANDPYCADSESGKTYTEEYVVHGGVSTHEQCMPLSHICSGFWQQNDNAGD